MGLTQKKGGRTDHMGSSSTKLGGLANDYEIAQEVADGLMEARVRPEHLQKGLQAMVRRLQTQNTYTKVTDREHLRMRFVLDALCERAQKRADFKALLEDPVCALYARHPDVEDLKQTMKEEYDLRQGRRTEQM